MYICIARGIAQGAGNALLDNEMQDVLARVRASPANNKQHLTLVLTWRKKPYMWG